MHLRFGQTPGRIYLDDIRVEDLHDGTDTVPVCAFEEGHGEFARHWTCWPIGELNTVGEIQVVPGAGRDGSGGLRIDLQKPANGEWPDFHIYHHANLALKQDHRYRVSAWVRADQNRDLTLAFYRPGEPFVFLGGPSGCFESQIKLAAEVGVDLVSFPLAMPWPRPGQPVDWAGVDRQCRDVVNANPRSLLLPRVWMGPPRWWLDAHPDDRMVWDKGPPAQGDVVVTSRPWRVAAAERLTALIEHLESTFGTHMAGYHPTGQNTGEWFYQNTWGPALNGYSKTSLHAWRGWLKDRYQDDTALQAAWNDSEVTIQTAVVPSPQTRRSAARLAAQSGVRTIVDRLCPVPAGDDGRLRVPFRPGRCAGRRGAASWSSSSTGISLSLPRFGTARPLPAITPCAACCNRPTSTCSARRSRTSTAARPERPGDDRGGERCPGRQDVALRGRHANLPGHGQVSRLAGSRRHSRRDQLAAVPQHGPVCRAELRYLVDGPGGTGWFNDPRMWAEMDRLKALDERLLQDPRPFRPEVAAVIDEREYDPRGGRQRPGDSTACV